MDIARAADTLSETEPEVTSDLLAALDVHRASDILEIMPPDEAADILSELSYDKAETLLGLMGVKEAKAVRSLLGYHEKTAGGIMTTSFLSIDRELTADETIEYIRSTEQTSETIYYIYVVDDASNLLGVVSLRDLIIADRNARIGAIMEREIISVNVEDDQEDVADVISKYDLLAVPVVDEERHLLGIVTVDDVIDVIEEETSEDIALLSSGSIIPVEPADTPRWFLDRLIWMSFVIVAGVLGGVVIRGYSGMVLDPQDFITRLLPVLLFIPLVVRLSDDLGMHAMAFIMSATREGRLDRADIIMKSVREAGLALMSSLFAFVVVSALSGFWQLQAGLASVIALSIFFTTAIASVTGTVMSKLLIKYEIEPSISYAPVISTLLAVAAIALYMGMATLLG